VILFANDIAIGYDEAGSGLPVVLLHGFPLNRSLWTAQLDGLAAPCRVLAFDLRGFGESTVTGPFSMDQWADDIAASLAALGIARAVIAGMSMGGYVAFALWRRHPALVRAMILADTRAGADDDDARTRRRELMAIASEKGSGPVADAMLPGMVGRTTREKQPDLAESIHRMMALAPPRGVVGALDALIRRPDSTTTLATIDVPALIVVGDEDVLTPPREARAIQQGIRGSRLEVLTGAGHVSNVERPAAFNHVVSEFLTSVTCA
jgi:3-oxoadipate enol-lactonase